MRYDFSRDGCRNEFVMDGHKMPRTTVPRLNAAYVLLHSRAGDCGESGGFLLLQSLLLKIAASMCVCGKKTRKFH